MADVTTIEIDTQTIAQTLTANDPSPEHEEGLTRVVAGYIEGRASEAPTGGAFKIRLLARKPDKRADVLDVFRAVFATHFTNKAAKADREFRQTLVRGMKSLAVGLVILAVCTAIGQAIDAMPIRDGLREGLRDGVSVLGWVANWRPVELLFYDWWPIRGERDLYRRLAKAEIEVG